LSSTARLSGPTGGVAGAADGALLMREERDETRWCMTHD
jgi:hypothetical protein